MTEAKKVGEVTRKVRVHARRTTYEDGKTDIAMTVFCPVRQHSVELEDCTSCQYCEGLTIDSWNRNAFLICRIKDAMSRPKVESPNPTLNELASAPVSAIMTKTVVCVNADLSLQALSSLFLARNISGAPVVDERGRPIGIVTKTDLIRELYDDDGTVTTEQIPLEFQGYRLDLGPGFHVQRTSTTKVRDIMMPATFIVPEATSIADAAAMMAREGVHRLVVVSPSGNVVGILSALDVLHWLVQAADSRPESV